MKSKKIVCFGGGNALPRVVLEPLKHYPLSISSITSMTDDGGSTGQLRRELGVLPPGDIRRHILALSDAPEWKKELWGMRFGSEEFAGGHRGHGFGNLFLAGLCRQLKNYDEVLAKCREFMEISPRYQPLPATTSQVTLCAELWDGQVIEGESEIDVPKQHDSELRISKIFLQPRARAYAPALAAIEQADALVFGPGDLYSSLLPCFLPQGMKRAIAAARAKKLLIVNIMNKRGETAGFTVADFALEVERYIGTQLDYVLYNKYSPEGEATSRAQASDGSVLAPVESAGELPAHKFIAGDLLKKGTVDNDPQKTAEALWGLISR